MSKTFSYDEIPYESFPFQQSHPNRLATIAKLFGASPVPPDNCRVLELGCAAGGNLIPIAVDFPEAEFVGVDFSSRQIEDGVRSVEILELSNIRLLAASILDIDQSFGEFDYILAHGVYSWVPDEVRRKILEICRDRLSPNGVAFISYNTYPGWHMKSLIREMMRYHANEFADPLARIGQARAMLDFLAQSANAQDAFGLLLKTELEQLRTQPDFYLAHEHLEDVNEPVYFHEFIERAGECDLQYLGEADINAMFANNLPAEVGNTLRKLTNDLIRMEQYMDFVRNRPFRQTLLMHKGIPLNRNIGGAITAEFAISSAAKPVSQYPDIRSNQRTEYYQTPAGAQLGSSSPITKAAMQVLAETWPACIDYAELKRRAQRLLGQTESLIPLAHSGTDGNDLLGDELLYAFSVGIVEFQSYPNPIAATVSDRPATSRLARHQAEKGLWVTSQRHERVILDEFTRRLLLLLDGSRDHQALKQEMESLVIDGTMPLQKDGQTIRDPNIISASVSEALGMALSNLARSALLIG